MMVPDAFAAQVVRIEDLGVCARVVFGVPQVVSVGESSITEMVIVAKIVMPKTVLAEIAHLLTAGRTVLVEMGDEPEERPARVN